MAEATRRGLAGVVLAGALALGGCPEAPPPGGPELSVRALDDPRLPNAHWITARVLSGAQPEGEEAFRKLAALGVRTVISVDGARPDLDLAHRAGLRYVHLPIGYDGVPERRALELARAIRESGGPVYIHCHHGQHRGPAAAAAGSVAAGLIDPAGALRVLEVMGTGRQYLGLWGSVRECRKAPEGALADFRGELPETCPVPPLVDSMVSLDAALDRLEAAARSGWKAPPGHPDLDPAHEALGIRELLTELLRTPELARRPEPFRKEMDRARGAAEGLEQLLRSLAGNAAADPGAPGPALRTLRESCGDCHRRYRNVASRPK